MQYGVIAVGVLMGMASSKMVAMVTLYLMNGCSQEALEFNIIFNPSKYISVTVHVDMLFAGQVQ